MKRIFIHFTKVHSITFHKLWGEKEKGHALSHLKLVYNVPFEGVNEPTS